MERKKHGAKKKRIRRVTTWRGHTKRKQIKKKK